MTDDAMDGSLLVYSMALVATPGPQLLHLGDLPEDAFDQIQVL